MRRRLVLSLTVVAAAVVLVASEFAAKQYPVQTATPHQPQAAPAHRELSDRHVVLPIREPIDTTRGALFESRTITPESAPAKATPVAVPVRPAVPPMPYRVAGKVVQDGQVQVLLAKGDALVTVRPGDMVDNVYRLDSIGDEKVTLVYLPLEARQELPVVSALAPAPRMQARSPVAATDLESAKAPSEPAQLRWQGPARVRAGDRFEVVLRVTSVEALRAAPLQVTFDATVLEPVEVRAGRFFDGGKFSYRINPAGSIFVGAAGKGAPASDEELFIISFKPIRPAPAAELRLSALVLQGARGGAIAHERPAVFRTTIFQ